MDFDRPHRRLNPLTGDWVLVSPHRARRPWLGQVEKVDEEILPSYDPSCYLCPGNQRSGGPVNPIYTNTFVFDNDFSALLPPVIEQSYSSGLLQAEPENGICRVVCFSPHHNLTLPELSQSDVEAVVQTWTEQTRELGKLSEVNYVQVFENKGAMMGCSNPHPHSQVWATGHIPNEPARELQCQADYYARTGKCLLCSVLKSELHSGERIIAANDHFTALVPFWAVWPFEVLLLSNRHLGSLTDLSASHSSSLADAIRQVTARYDNLFKISFPYSMGFHQSPCDGQSHPGHHLHAHFFPPLLRSATVRKFMVGFEMLGMPQRDLTPEAAAARLKSLPVKHFRSS